MDQMPANDDDHGWGIAPGYHDVWGNWKTPDPEAVARLRRAMGAHTDDPDEPAPSGPPLRIVRPGEPTRAGSTRPSTLFLEDGTQLKVRNGEIPPDLPLVTSVHVVLPAKQVDDVLDTLAIG